MKYEPEPLECPKCGKEPEVFLEWDEIENEFGDNWIVACRCNPDWKSVGETKIEAVAMWNNHVDCFDPMYDKHRYHDNEEKRKVLENIKKFKKMIEETKK